MLWIVVIGFCHVKWWPSVLNFTWHNPVGITFKNCEGRHMSSIWYIPTQLYKYLLLTIILELYDLFWICKVTYIIQMIYTNKYMYIFLQVSTGHHCFHVHRLFYCLALYKHRDLVYVHPILIISVTFTSGESTGLKIWEIMCNTCPLNLVSSLYSCQKIQWSDSACRAEIGGWCDTYA